MVSIRSTPARHFLRLLADPAYGPMLPYKLATLKLVLVPTASELVVSDLRSTLGAGLLILFLTVSWVRACGAARH